MRKTLIAMLGLAALVVWALPALASNAGDPPLAERYKPLDGRAGAIGALANHGNYTATLSGTVVKQAALSTTTWFLYPGACQQRALGTWAAKTAEQADSLDSYTTGGDGSYGTADQSLKEVLWHKVLSSTTVSQRPDILTGTASLWCGKYDPSWHVAGPGNRTCGYPNQTFQLLYIDTGTHAAPYNLTLSMNQSSEFQYDYVYLMGGGGGTVDPIGNDRPTLDDLILPAGTHGTSRRLVQWTGTINSTTPGATSINAAGASVLVQGSGTGQPNVASLAVSINSIPALNRALYVLFTADCLYSNEDGLWSFGNGAVWDNLVCSDNGSMFADGTAPVGSDPTAGGQVIQGTFGSQGYIAGRVTAGTGTLWQIVAGNFAVTTDNCQTQKNDAVDKMFFGVDAGTKKTIPGQFNSIVSCSFPVPNNTASIIAAWGEYLNEPGGSGYVQFAEYRFYKSGIWSGWKNTRGQDVVVTSNVDTWAVGANELSQATQAESVQVRYNLECIPSPVFATDGVCQQVDYGIMYDDLFLQFTTGVPAPVFSLFPGNAPQSTFVDGTIHGLNCTTTPCWPGIRGSDVVGGPGNSNMDIHDNVNCPLGDSLTVVMNTGLRKDGMGINWKQGYDKAVNEGLTIAHTNNTYNAAFDQPRVIYRLFDPTSHTWSPFDSSVLDANYITVNPGVDTSLLKSEFRWNWPPRDKAGTNLPPASGGWPGSINGISAYNSLVFLPRGTRLQYYFKAVDLNGGTSYLFSTDDLAREQDDLPTLPGSSILAPDINTFMVLPGAYAGGAVGTLLAGRTNTPVLNLDANYGGWNFQQDPVTSALRGLGVRADRFRRQGALGEGNGVGGHELTGPPDNQRQPRQSNHFPNITEYAVRESLSTWYRIMIESTHDATAVINDESDARLMTEWWNSATGSGANQGDRCLLITGDDYFNQSLNAPTAPGDPAARRIALCQDVMGVNSVTAAWAGSGQQAFLFPNVDDRFANPGSGPALITGYTYPVDGGCPTPNRFDALSKNLADAAEVAFFPTVGVETDIAGIAMHTEKDAVTDNDRNKALAYGYSFQFIRKPGVPTGAANFVHSGVDERMQVLYKFLASCRGARSGAASDTAKCWPCPTDANKFGNWNALAGFQTSQYGPLYPIQDNTTATGVEVSDASGAPRVNKINGNFPNPFNPQTTIRYSSAQAGKVMIRIFNVGGQLVRSLSTKADAGANEVRWNGRRDDGTPLASGVYFYKVKFADGSESGSRMALVK